jgi:hypothetical protein
MVMLWVVGGCFMVVNERLYGPQFMMIVGFGAILTLLLLRYPALFLISVAVVIFGTCLLMWAAAGPAQKGVVLSGILRASPVFALLLGLGVWLNLKPLRRGELVLVYSCVLIAIPWSIGIKAVLESSTANLLEVQKSTEPQLYAWARQMPWWGPTIERPDAPKPPEEADLAPDAPPADPARAQQVEAEYEQRLLAYRQARKEADERTTDAVMGFARGNGGRVPWGMWWRPILFWTATCICYEAMLMGLLLLLRRRWIEHERLPFVWSQPALQLIRDEPRAFARLRTWLPLLIGLAICLPAIVMVGPAGERLSTWTIPPWAGQEGLLGGVDLTEYNILPKTQLSLYWGPLILLMLLLFPLDVLMTTALLYLTFIILGPGLLRAAGVTVKPGELHHFVKYGIRFGGGAGLLVWSFVFALIDWIRTPRTSRGRRSLSASPSTWAAGAIAVAGLIGSIALGSHSTSLLQLTVLTGLLLVYAFSQVRQRVEGQIFNHENNVGSHQMVSFQRDILHDHYGLARTDPSVPVRPHSWATHWLQWGFVAQLKTFGPHNMLLEAFKIGHELKVRSGTIARATLLTMAVVAIVTPLLYIQLMYTYGFENSYQGELSNLASFTQWSERSESYGFRSVSKAFWLPTSKTGVMGFLEQNRYNFYALGGMLAVGGLFYLRRELPRFPLSPIGFVLISEQSSGDDLPYTPGTIWFSFLLAWLIKSLIFRWLGVRTFRERVQPVVILILCGIIFGMMTYICRYAALGLGHLR